MKILREGKPNPKSGRRIVTVELESHEGLIPVNKSGHYRLGGQIDDIVESHVLQDSYPVIWCHFEQKWIDV